MRVNQPTSDAIVYMTYSSLGEYYAIGVMQPDGSLQRIAIDGYDEGNDVQQGSLSPDGANILYDADDTAIKRLNLATGVSTTLYSSPTYCYTPSYRPDGQKIAFCNQDENNYYSLYTMNADGSNVQLLKANDGEMSYTLPMWNPSGTKIVYQRGWGENDDPQLVIMDADSSDEVVLTDSGGNSHPSFLPDGRILYIHQDVEASKDVWVMDADGSNKQQLTDTPGVSETFPTSNADGTKIAFSTGSDIYVADFNGSTLGEPTNITADNQTPCWRPAFGRIINTALAE